MIGKRKQMRPQFAQRHRPVHRRAVVQDVQIALLKVYDRASHPEL